MTFNEDGVINFHVANRAATHLGRNLYSTTPPALAELIANSYDAYATEVHVTIDRNIDHIVVADNGMGMGLGALRDKYALIGREKSPEPVPDGFKRRSPMGQKGIGKLASFSLGDEYEVYTKTEGDSLWRHFTVLYADFIKDNSDYPVESEMCSLSDELEKFSGYSHGFIIVIRGLRRGVNAQTVDFLKTQLSRRFYIKSGTGQFELFINEESVDLSLNEYYGSMDYATYIGYTENEIQELLGTRNHPIQLEQFDPAAIKDEGVKISLESLVSDKGLKGWIGTVEQPKQLKEHGNNANIIVYINGKIADEDVLKNYASSMIANQYVVGEFLADYLSRDAEDPITSSRQGLNNADGEVRELIEAIKSMRSKVINTWDTRREAGAVKRLPSWVAENTGYQRWLEGLDTRQRQLHNRMVKQLTVQMDEQEQNEGEMRLLLNCFIDVVENDAIYQISEDLAAYSSATQGEQLVVIAQLLKRIEASESIKHASIVQQRLQAIKTLETLMKDSSTVEKTFEEHLAKNPWLINPYWNQSPKTQEEIRVVTQEFNRLVDESGEEYRRTFIDICIYVADEKYPIIVEIKRNEVTSYSRVSFTQIYDQITRYRRAIRKRLGSADENIREIDIPAFFIGAEDMGAAGLGHAVELTPEEISSLKQQFNITLLTYRDLVLNAKREYRQHIDVIESRKDVPYFEV